MGGAAKKMKNRRMRMGKRRPRIDSNTARGSSNVVNKDDLEYVNIPVTALRCASELTLDYNVVFEMKPQDVTGQ